MPKCDRCGSTENVQRSLVVDMPERCWNCIEKDLVAKGWEFKEWNGSEWIASPSSQS